MIYQKPIGASVKGHVITARSNYVFDTGRNSPFTLIIGGMHGNERAPVPVLEHFITRYLENKKITSPVCVVPLLNPDGYRKKIRFNAHGVDLNRNFPINWSSESDEPPGPKPLSEPESQALYQFIERYEPTVIVNLHWALSEIDADGKQSVRCAKMMWDALSKQEKNRYRLTIRTDNKKASVSCPGSLGQLCGYGLRYSNNKRPVMITLELPYTHKNTMKLHPLPENNFDIMVDLWKKSSGDYLKMIEPGAHAMLAACCKKK